MREAAEALDQFQMQNGPFQRLGIAGFVPVLFEQRDAVALVLDVFRMLEGEIEEGAQYGFDLFVEAFGERPSGRGRASGSVA